MNRSAKAWMIAAAVLIAVGIALFAAVISVTGWNIADITERKTELKTFKIYEEFDGISIYTDIADIEFIPSQDGKCKVLCYEVEDITHIADVREGILEIKSYNNKKWYDYIGIVQFSPKIEIYLPDSEYGNLVMEGSTGDVTIPENFSFADIDIELSTGDVKSGASSSGTIKITADTGHIDVRNITAKELELKVSTGNITAESVSCTDGVKITVSTGKSYLANLRCGFVDTQGNTGDIFMTDVIASGKISVKRSTGDVSFDGCDANELFIETNTGDVAGSLLTDKVFITDTSTGDIGVPESANGGRCEITTTTGDVYMVIK